MIHKYLIDIIDCNGDVHNMWAEASRPIFAAKIAAAEYPDAKSITVKPYKYETDN